MPMITVTGKARIELQHNLISGLDEKCKSCELLRGKIAQRSYTYEVYRNYTNVEDTFIIAIAAYGGGIYAMYALEEVAEKKMRFLEYFLKDLEPEDVIIVFSEKIFKAVKKYSYGRPINVELYV